MLLATLDRPTVGYSACAVPKGSLVLEEGYQNTFSARAPGRISSAYPQGFERYGVAQRFEVNLIGPNVNRSRDTGGVSDGQSDMGFGFKYELQPRGRFTYAVDGLYTLPTGTGGFGSGGPTQTVNLDIAYAASPAVGFGATLAGSDAAGYEAVGDLRSSSSVAVAARYGTFDPSFVVTVDPGDAVQLYAELVGETKVAPGASGRLFTDFGVQKLLGPYLELDLEYGHDVVAAHGVGSDYVGFGTGIRIR